jgi:GT2 family glycosyltransferase
MRPIKLVSATQVPRGMFWSATYLGRSLRRFPETLRPPLQVVCGNSGSGARGLSEIFNQAIDMTDPGTDLVFVHDDVYLNDWFLATHVALALQHFDVVGLAGSANPDLSQPAWGLHFDARLNPLGWQPGLRRSGAVNHFDYACPDVTVYGPAPMPCTLLDGMFLAVRTSALAERGVRFDPRFRFHCYDIDFCRTAREKGLRIGTWPIAVTHDSGGAFGTASFKEAARLYLEKWPATAGMPVSREPEGALGTGSVRPGPEHRRSPSEAPEASVF